MITSGTVLEPLELPAVSRTTLALFAGASGDHNPVHIDLDAARAAGRDDVFAQGMLSMAYLGRLLTAWAPQDRLLSLKVRFVAITPLYARPVCHGTVRSVADGVATVDLQVRLADGTTTLTGTATLRAA
ncbi:MaoC/PaaZ C-terminal domain-containing protein [Streptomyces sp. NPDC006733]|uniref:MaoC/PaaZ C-terminal domain-containing protein n=1 Tax=Streptomyces sp. NPDC006733 TaxID=3155460 RepID=UPI0033DD9510